MKKKTTTKKASARKAPKTEPVTIDIDVVDKLAEDAITTIMAQRLVIHKLCDALEEAQR